MITWNEAQQLAKATYVDVPQREFKFFAYKAGIAKEFENMIQAKAYSPNVEKVETDESKEARMVVQQANMDAANRTMNTWLQAFKDEYSDLTPTQFDVIYQKAYQDGHSGGYDEILNEFHILYDFAMQFKKA